MAVLKLRMVLWMFMGAGVLDLNENTGSVYPKFKSDYSKKVCYSYDAITCVVVGYLRRSTWRSYCNMWC